MNIKCLICSDLFVPQSDISATPCGHLFHFSCLLQWLDRSRSCPQCRSKATEKTIHKVFLSIEDNPNCLIDPASLQNHVDSLSFQLKMKSMDVDKATEQLKVSKEQTLGLRKEVKDLEDKIRTLDSAMHALQDQIRHFKSKAKECERLQEEAAILKNKINGLERVQLVITGSRDQVNDMLRHNRDPSSLTILVSTLKKELVDSDRRKKQIQVLLKDAQSEVHSKVQDLMALSKANTQLLQKLEIHKQCDSEREYLKKKLGELQAAFTKSQIDSHNNTINRILLESPVPLPKDKHFSPSLHEKVQSIKDSDSPYLRVQSSSVGLSELMNYNHHTTTKKSSIFNIPSLKIQHYRKPSTSVSYDGFGGHSKDEHIPLQRSQGSNSRKRSKSSSTIPSAKLRKLAPQQKIDQMFDLTNES